jgi:hypothetical protein
LQYPWKKSIQARYPITGKTARADRRSLKEWIASSYLPELDGLIECGRLQEYILARQIVWIGKGNLCLCIDDVLFRALPNLCDVFDIREAAVENIPGFTKFYSSMVGARAGKIDPTRVMELLGNRTASFPDDEVYGAMAASGVIIQPGVVSGQNEIWSL